VVVEVSFSPEAHTMGGRLQINKRRQLRIGRFMLANRIFIGLAKIMLRPEQIPVQQTRTGDKFACKVEAVEFGGAKSMIKLRFVADDAAGEARIVLHRNGMDGLRIGDLVSISVIGTADVFPPMR
jgi:iron(III) transport system ATP-binding protein